METPYTILLCSDPISPCFALPCCALLCITLPCLAWHCMACFECLCEERETERERERESCHMLQHPGCNAMLCVSKPLLTVALCRVILRTLPPSQLPGKKLSQSHNPFCTCLQCTHRQTCNSATTAHTRVRVEGANRTSVGPTYTNGGPIANMPCSAQGRKPMPMASTQGPAGAGLWPNATDRGL